MKNVTNLFLIGAGLFFGLGCYLLSGIASANKPKDAFPEIVGKYKLSNVGSVIDQYYLNDKNKSQKYQSWNASYSGATNLINNYVGVHKDETMARNEVEFLAECIGKDVWKNVALKNKSGKEVGSMMICRDKVSSSGSSSLGGFKYSFAFSNENRTYQPKGSGVPTLEIIEFTKALPFTADLDLAVLDELISTNPDKTVNLQELQKITPPVKLAAKPYLKGKTVVTESSSISTGSFITDEKKRATTPDEINSIVQITCEKGKKIGDYIVKGMTVPAYGSTCKVNVIDNTIPAIIAQKSFTNSSLPQTTMFTTRNGVLTSYEYVAPYPNEAVKKFVQGLPSS